MGKRYETKKGNTQLSMEIINLILFEKFLPCSRYGKGPYFGNEKLPDTEMSGFVPLGLVQPNLLLPVNN